MLLLVILFPFLIIHFSKKKYRLGLLNRLGFRFFTPSDHRHKYLMVHAVSVGEINAAVPLIDKLLKLKEFSVLITCTTQTGFENAKRLFPNTDIEYFPMDFYFSVRRFFNHFSIRHIFILETEIWPQFFGTAKLRGVPISIINGRISDRSFPRFKQWRIALNIVWSGIQHVFCASSLDFHRFEILGVPTSKLRLIPSMKFDAAWSLRSRIGIFIKPEDYKVLTIGSSHYNEHIPLIDSFLKVHRNFPQLRCVLVPRKIDTLSTVFDDLNRRNIPFRKWSELKYQGLTPETVTSVFDQCPLLIVDTMGELVSFYQISDIVFIGKTLGKESRGGQNPLEAAMFGNIILTGEYYENFREIVDQLLSQNGILVIHSQYEIENTLFKILTNYEEYVIIAQNAKNFVESKTGACDLILKTLKIGLENTVCAD